MKYFLEACCSSVEDVLLAVAGGAGRIELCEELSCGGVTPSLDLIRAVKRVAPIPVNVLVRPALPSVRPGLPFNDPSQYIYSVEEAALLLDEIAACREAGADGIVAGCLKNETSALNYSTLADGFVDEDLLRKIINAAGPLPVTFHKAFDACARPLEALESIISAGCKRVLTSGCASTALEGLPLLAELMHASAGRITIMPGGSIRPSNISGIFDSTHAVEFHASVSFFQQA